MRILCITDFMDGATLYAKGDLRTVDDADGERFVGFGWAVQEGDPLPDNYIAPAVSLDIHKSFLGLNTRGL